MIARVLLYWLGMVGGATAIWVWQGQPDVEARNVALAFGFAGLVAFGIWLKWDVAKARQVEKLLNQHNRSDP